MRFAVDFKSSFSDENINFLQERIEVKQNFNVEIMGNVIAH